MKMLPLKILLFGIIIRKIFLSEYNTGKIIFTERIMSIVSAFLFGLSANIDAFVLGLSYGFKNQRFPLLFNMCVSLITLLGTLAALWAGSCLAAIFPSRFSMVLGSLLLVVLGFYYCIKFLAALPGGKSIRASSLREQKPAQLSFRETMILGMALALNNMGMGIGASFAGLSIPLAGLFAFLLCAGLLLAGNAAGLKWHPRRLSACGDLLSGGIIFLLGSWQLISCFLS